MGAPDHESTPTGGETIRTQYDWAATAPSQAIVEAVATVEETTPVALVRETGTTLYDHVDPEALDLLVGGDRNGSLEVAFDIDSLHITIASGGQLVISVGDQ
ncbi:HalOD1 output domain-containing protein [Natronorubrum sp. FCH18a]|uniref:HalOD1 output domain-containing protein n=1 Tax=Natronorubrum sp. FCH18a TaxID=3447018 RepID=UPI003F50EA51